MIRLARHSRDLARAALCVVLMVPTAAQAQTVDPAKAVAAQALYEQATGEMDARNYASACPKLEEVTRLVPEGMGAKLTLGECYEAVGKLASAWSQYALVEAAAAKAAQPDRARRAAEKAAALKPRLATLVIEVPDAVRAIHGIAITRDGVAVGSAQWGVPVPADAGGHDVVASAPGHTPWKKRVEIVADGAEVSVAVKPPQPDPQAGPGRTPDTPPQRTWQRPVGLAAMGIGVAGVGLGAALGGLAISKNGASNEDNHCDATDHCDATGTDLRNQALGLGTGSTIAIAVGGVALAGGAVLFFTAPSRRPERTGSTPAPRVASVEITPGGLLTRGTW